MANRLRDQKEELLGEAVDWLMRLRALPADRDAERQWQAWLALSDAHRAAWERVCRTWQVLGDVTPGPDLPSLASPGTERDAAPPQTHHQGRMAIRKPWRSFAGMALAAGLLAFLFGPPVMLHLRSDYITGTAETRVVKLRDGSTVTLAPGSALAEDIDGATRRVSLLAGEAFFDVIRDEARPFLVEADGNEIRVLGTAFSVGETGEGTRVELAEGTISLRPAIDRSAEITLAPGDAVTVDSRNGIARRDHVDPLDIALWRQGRITVTDQPLALVVELIQRYHPAWIVIPDRSIAARRVTGLYDLRNPDLALAALVEPFGAKVHRVSPYLRVISRY